MKWYADYMRSHQGFANRLCHFIGFTTIVMLTIWNWRFFPFAVLFDLAISSFGHWLDGNTPFFLAGNKFKAVAGYILMNLAFIWEYWAELIIGFGLGYYLARGF